MVVCPPGIRFFLEKGRGFSLIDLGGFHYAVRFGDTVMRVPTRSWSRIDQRMGGCVRVTRVACSSACQNAIAAAGVIRSHDLGRAHQTEAHIC